MNKTDLAWLAGIIDGEGTVSFNKGRSGKNRPTPVIMITNTSESLISKSQRILFDFDIDFKILRRKFLDKKWAKSYWKPCLTIYVRKLKSVENLLILILPYLACKDEQAKLVLESLRSVKRTRENYGRMASLRVPFANRVWDLNKRGLKEVTHI